MASCVLGPLNTEPLRKHSGLETQSAFMHYLQCALDDRCSVRQAVAPAAECTGIQPCLLLTAPCV
eukprot:1501281-Amphidinium_carterae.1